MSKIDFSDKRWLGHIPWFLRHSDFDGGGNFVVFFDRVGHRLKQFVLHGEAGPTLNPSYLGDLMESESHQCFRFDSRNRLDTQLQRYFSPNKVEHDTIELAREDLLVTAELERLELIKKKLSRNKAILYKPEREKKYIVAQNHWYAVLKKQCEVYRPTIVRKRLTALEAFLRLIASSHYDKAGIHGLLVHLRRYLAEAQIMLDIAEDTMLLVPIEQPLLQKEVIDRLLPRLTTRFPQQGKDIVKAYHDLVQGVDNNTVFGNAFKAIEEIARQVSRNEKLLLSDGSAIARSFPNLHPTVRATIEKLAAHRGDKGAHGRNGPDNHEMRYLLFAMCNLALLFLDYPEQAV